MSEGNRMVLCYKWDEHHPCLSKIWELTRRSAKLCNSSENTWDERLLYHSKHCVLPMLHAKTNKPNQINKKPAFVFHNWFLAENTPLRLRLRKPLAFPVHFSGTIALLIFVSKVKCVLFEELAICYEEVLSGFIWGNWIVETGTISGNSAENQGEAWRSDASNKSFLIWHFGKCVTDIFLFGQLPMAQMPIL